MIHVAIVSPEKSLEPIEKVLQDPSFDCQFFPYIYKDLKDIDSIYEDCKKKCDVIFFSGELGYHYIHQRFPDNRIPFHSAAISNRTSGSAIKPGIL